MKLSKKILVVASSLEEAENAFGITLPKEKTLLIDDLPGFLYQSTETEGGLGMLIAPSKEPDFLRFSRTDKVAVLNHIPLSLAVVDREQNIVWHNNRFRFRFGSRNHGPDEKESEQTEPQEDVSENFEPKDSNPHSLIHQRFYRVVGDPLVMGPDYCPFHTVRKTGLATQTGLKTAKNDFYQMDVVPFPHRKSQDYLLVALRDISEAKIAEQQLDTLMKAGLELPDLSSDQIQEMTSEDRISLLKSNIIRQTMELLNYDIVEIRLIAREGGLLEPLLAYGMSKEAEQRKLYAKEADNGITGYVAVTGKSYLCEDTAEDPLYLPGSSEAKSSLTVPLIHQNAIVGTFNVESPKPRAFTERNMRFLEIFARNVAAAIHTLDLLSAQNLSSTMNSVEAIHSAVALPIDTILNDAVYVTSNHKDLEPALTERLNNIQTQARQIRAVIQQIGLSMSPAQAHPFPPPNDKHSFLRGANILVVDGDEEVRIAANDLLARYGCNIESAPKSEEALLMVQNIHYDAIISDIRLKDCSGYEFLLKLREVLGIRQVPLLLMTGFGYDAGHVVVKARQEGVDAFLYKPFLLDQLLTNLELVIIRGREGVDPREKQ